MTDKFTNRLVKYLLEEGAKVNQVDRWHETPLSNALRHGHDEVADYIRAEGGVSIWLPTSKQKLTKPICSN